MKRLKVTCDIWVNMKLKLFSTHCLCLYILFRLVIAKSPYRISTK